ncbi:MAG: 4Fe-4S binding protein, partial [Bacillota bacterium]
MKRLIVKIDEEKCDGCGLCVPACAEGALQIVDGKARLVADNLCDGLGACLGHCPRGAIGVEEREAAPFAAPSPAPHEAPPSAVPSPAPCEAASSTAPSPAPHESMVPPQPLLACGCPASALEEQMLPSLGNWPVQIRLVPPGASFLKNAHLVVAADCTAFACPDFHRRFLPGRALLVGCPKLDDARAY